MYIVKTTMVMRCWAHYYGAFVVSKPHTWPNGVQIMRMAMTLFWPLDGWKCHNAFVWCMFLVCVCERGLGIFFSRHTSELFEISVNVNEITVRWKIDITDVSSHETLFVTAVLSCVRACVWVWVKEWWFSTVSFTHVHWPLVRHNIVFQLAHMHI